MTAAARKNGPPAQSGFAAPRVLRALLKTQPTPFYLYDAAGLQTACREISGAFSWNEGLRLYFPVRMNPNPAILDVLHRAGCGALCASGTELQLAARAGLTGEQIIYAPMAWQEDSAAFAAREGAPYLMDSEDAPPAYAPRTLLLSLNPGGMLTLEGRPVWDLSRLKLGMKVDSALRLLQQISAAGRGETKLGLAMHLRDQEAEPERFLAAAELLFQMAAQAHRHSGVRVDACLIVGGLGACYRKLDKAVDLAALSSSVKGLYETHLAPLGLHPALQLAPGRWIAAKSGVLVSRVLAVKWREVPLAILDVSCAQFLREIAFGSVHRVTAPFARGEDTALTQLAGCLADPRDHFPGSYVLPPLAPGSCVMIHDVGADGHSFGNHYGGSPLCAEFLLETDGTVREIFRRQTHDALLAQYGL